MLVPIPSLHCGAGLLMVVLSMPPVLRKIPMNRVYGIRTRKAFVFERNWYELNAYGGRVFLALGLLLLAFGWLGARVAPPPTSLWAPVFMVVPLLAVVPAIVLINVFGRRLPDR